MRYVRVLVVALLFLVGIAAAPALSPQGRWDALWDGNPEAQASIARGVSGRVAQGVTEGDFRTGSARFDSEWTFGTSMMAAMGLGQVALEHPETAAEQLPAIRAAIDAIIAPSGHRFDTDAWSEDPFDALESDRGHIALLGYLGLAMSIERVLDPKGPHADLHDRVIAALIRRYEASPDALVETYPGEWFPVDNASGIGAIALYDRATGADHSALIARWSTTCRKRWIDPETGLLLQQISAEGQGIPRGSGTLLAVYFLGYADPALSRDLFDAARKQLKGSALGWTAIREYPPGINGAGDIDSGPIVAGFGVSATGFAIAGARMHGDEALYHDLASTAELFGAPAATDESTRFVTGGPLGDAILLAMFTAPRLEAP